MMKKINRYLYKVLSFAIAAIFAIMMLGSCGGNVSDEEDDVTEENEIQTLNVEDKEYYKKFQGKNITINVYNWGEYISDGSDDSIDVNSEFTKLTGINVNYTTYATNEELYAKLKGGAASYDVIIPSDYMISRMIDEDMIVPLNHDNIPNLKYVMDSFKNPEYDPNCQYSVPYTWGTVGIIYDSTVVDIDPEDIDWDILWDEDYADRILMFDNPRDAFAIAQTRLGISMNTEDEKELEQAAELLKEQKPVVQAYVMDEIFDKMGAGEAIIAPYYAGDGVMLMDEYEDLSFVIPKSGTNLFFDAACIPKNSKYKEAAEMYINFLSEPDIAYANSMYIGYSTPNQGAYDMLDDEVKENGISYLDDEYLSGHTTTFKNLSNEANKKMQDLWTELKATEQHSNNLWIVPVFMCICIGLSIFILIRRHIKKKKDIF